MLSKLKPKNAVAFVRVSSTKQSFEGDSPDTQKQQIQRLAYSRNLRIKKTFTFFESASKEGQPILKVMDYISDPKNRIEVVAVKSMDRLTRRGPGFYLDLVAQLDSLGIQVIDTSGVISNFKVNTLEHFGVSYKWSVYRPTKNAEIIEAERGSDEIRDICTRTIGSEIHYTRQGYWMRQPPFGFASEKVETPNGKRSLLVRLPAEAYFIEKMFELRSRGTMHDEQIVEEINRLGYKSRVSFRRSRQDQAKIIGKVGGCALTATRLQDYIKNPIYAGVVYEKWTLGQAVRGKFAGLVSFKTFNMANRGKIVLQEDGGQIVIKKKPQSSGRTMRRGIKSADYPYRKAVICPLCELPLYGSASRGQQGTLYPAYHCSRNGHYFRVPKDKFEQTVEAFVKKVRVAPEFLDDLTRTVGLELDKRQQAKQNDTEALINRISELEYQAKILAHNIAFTKSSVQASYAERELGEIDKQIQYHKKQLPKEDELSELGKDEAGKYVRRLGRNIGDLVFSRKDVHGKAASLALLFYQAPTYAELDDATAKHTLAELFTR